MMLRGSACGGDLFHSFFYEIDFWLFRAYSAINSLRAP